MNAEQSTILKLNRFVHARPSAPAADSGPTETISGAVLEAVQQTCAKSARPVVVANFGPALPPHSMLGILTYCYAKGVYGSEDIERKLRQDAVLKTSHTDHLPDSRTIRHFRRLNREAIQATLERIFRLLRTKYAPIASRSLETTASLPNSGADNPGESTILFVRREAADRIDRAIFIDGMSMEN